MLYNEVEFRTIEYIENFVQTDVDGFLQELGVKQVLNLEGDVAENHGKGEILERTSTRSRFAPTAFRIVSLGEHDVESLLRNVGILLNASRFVELSESDDGKGVGEDIVGLNEWTTFAIEREVPVQVAVVSVFLQELGSLNGSIKPLLLLLHFVVKRCQHPYLAALQPNELVGIIDLAVSFDAGEITTELFVYTVLHPERHHPLQQFALVLSS